MSIWIDRIEDRELIFEEVEEFSVILHRYLFAEVYFPIDNVQDDLKFCLIRQNPLPMSDQRFDLNLSKKKFFPKERTNDQSIYSHR